ncbi:MAG: YhdP family protein [Gammaproteobacteria bacterium]
MIHHITRATRHLIFWSLITVALSLTGLRLVLTMVDNYKVELQRHLSAIVEAPVRIGTLKARMHGLTPSLVLRDIKVAGGSDDKQTPVKLDEIRLHINLREALFSQDLWTSSWITLVGAELTVKQREDGSFAIVGLKASAEDENPLWLLQGGKFELLHSRITWQQEKNDVEPLTFDRVNLLIKNDADRHQLHMLVTLPEDYGDSLRVSMALDGNFFEPNNVNGRMYLEGHGVRLAKLADVEWPGNLTLDSRSCDFKIWTEWRRSQWVGVTGEVKLQQVSVKVNRREVLAADNLSSRFNWQRQRQGWQLDVDDFILVAENQSWPPARFSIRGRLDSSGQLQRIALVADGLALPEARRILTLPGVLPARQAELLAGLKLSGRLEDLTLVADLKTRRFEVDGRFQGLGFSAFETVPGVSGLSGLIHGNERQGWLQLDTGVVRLDSGGWFRHALSANRLEGRINWRQTPGYWTVQSSRIELDAPGIESQSRLKLVLPKNERSPFLDLQTAFSMTDVKLVSQYLPVSKMNPATVAWLDRAFIDGRIPDGGMLYYGRLADFPFTDGQGVFEVLFNTEHLALEYHPNWPLLSDLDAEVRFWSESLAVNVRKAKTLQCSIDHAVVTIPSFERSKHVKVRGQMEGRIPKVLGFLQRTPLKAPVDHVLSVITPDGNTSIKLELDAPMTEQAPIIVDGRAVLKGAQLALGSTQLPVTQINGVLKFNELGVFTDGLEATALEYPIKVNIDSQPGQTVVKVAGQAGLGDVQKRFELPDWTWATGTADYRLELKLPHSERSASELVIQTDLQGVTLALPESLAKTSEQKRPLALTFQLGDEQLMPVSLNYDNQLKASFVVDVSRRSIASGHFLYGQGRARGSGTGITLEANRERMQLESWLGLSKGLDEGSGMPVTQIKIHTDHLINDNKDLGQLDWTLKKTANAWKGGVRSHAAVGEITVPADLASAEKIKLDMDFIDFSVLKHLRLGEKPRQDGPLPLFDIRSQNTFWRSVDLGRLELETERIPTGLAFKRIELTGPQRKLNLTGSWSIADRQASTRLEGSFSSEAFGHLLTELGLYDDMKETNASLNFALDWQGAPYQFALAELNGHVDVKLKNGRLSSIEPGIGRVLGILAFAQWGKRLQLDFRDVYKEGLSFNSIRGRIYLEKGMAHTDNLIVNAVPAKISLIGDANLIDRTLDQWVTVVPKSSDAVPIAGTIVSRIAGFVASTVTDDYKEGYFFGSEYQVKGPWQEPKIIPFHENDGLFKKTWQGITDFPWLEEK